MDAAPPAGPGREKNGGRGRWVTAAGRLSAGELEAACRDRGVRADRGRRAYWQAERAFPQPERRALRVAGGRAGIRGYYHPGAVDLACLIDYVTRPDHPAKASPWRVPVRDLARSLATWRAEAGGDGPEGEAALYARVAGLAPAIAAGAVIPGLDPAPRDVLPPGWRPETLDRDEALGATAHVAEALANDWVRAHDGTADPDRLVVWFRLERAGPDRWRITDAGARRTRHEVERARINAGSGAAPLSDRDEQN
ncbi:MAG: hypothetical protein AB7V42_04290 [Thermoleophilia bacterium]